MISREYLSRNDLFHLNDQLLLIQIRLTHILQQNPYHSAGIKT